MSNEDFMTEFFKKKQEEDCHFVKVEMKKLSKRDKEFIESHYSTDLLKRTAIEGILYARKNHTPLEKRKTHSHNEVMEAVLNIQKSNPGITAKDLIDKVALTLEMTPRAVSKHYYLK
jgi:hypothetical protein